MMPAAAHHAVHSLWSTIRPFGRWYPRGERDLDAACLRQVLGATARHDAATDTFDASGGARTDTDAPGKSDADWGHGKLDIAAASTALDPYPTCTGGCVSSASCGTGFKCNLPTSPCGCGTCVACATAGASCTANSQCCSNDCRGKTGRKTCR